MPGVALHPNTPVPGLGGLPAARKSMPPPSTHSNSRPTTAPAAHNGASGQHESVAEIKNRAIEFVNKEARGASGISLIRTAQSQFAHAKDCEARGDLRGALASYIKSAQLARMSMSSAEFTQERKGKGVLHKELNDFLDGDGRDITALSHAVEEKLKAIEKSHSANGSDSVESKPARSIAERMRALQDNGLSIEPTKRISRDISNLPTPPLSPPLSPNRFPSSSSSAQPQLPSITTVFPPQPPAAPTPSVFVPTSALGPPSPQSSPSSSPQMNSFDFSGFSQAFPSIDELDENPAFQLPSVPTGVSVASNRSNKNAESNSASPITSFRNFAVPIERPSSTPITPVNNAFASRPASPTKVSSLRPSGLSATTSAHRSPIPVRNVATPKELLSYINDWKVLLVDVRERADFEREHIGIDSVVCIEPSVLRRSNVTSLMLEDSMSIAPVHEATLFGNRDKFDLVAVYDASSEGFGGSDSLLSILVRVISERAFQKMLKRMPMMLIGGLAAWKRDIGDSKVWRSESAQFELQRPTPTTPLPASGLFSSTDNHQSWTPRVNGDTGHRSTYSLDQSSGHSRSPADATYTGSHPAPERPLGRKLALSRPPSGSLSYSRGTDNIPPALPLTSINGLSSPTPSSIKYPQFPRRISPTSSGSASASVSGFSPPTPFTSAPISYDNITSPPQASINPSGLSRRRSDFIDQSQEALSSFNNTPRAPIDYPELALRPPPAVASPVLERQDRRAVTNAAPKPPRVNYEYPATYWADMQIGTSGLKNMGNTCYMNAPIQCLSATVPFARFFTENHWRQAVNCVNPLGSKGQLTGSFAKLLHEMWGGDMPYLVPADFRRMICKLNSQYDGGEQHDSQEFLSFLIDGIHEDLNRVMYKPKIMTTPEQEAELESLPQQVASDREWRVWRSLNDSLIVDFFQGQFRNRLECLTCHTTSTTYNVFSILQLPIPHTNSGKVHIQSCLDTLLNEEVLERDDAWDCPKCKTKRSASKKLSLARLPPVLLIHFKRFKYKGAFVDKIDTFVDFPMKSFDLTNYMPSPLPPGADKSQLNGGLPMSPDDPRTQLPPYRYDLYGVTNHYGSLSGGHYTAFIASRGGWMYCDDSSVKPVEAKSVVNQKAYVLFYKRVRQ